VQLIELASEQSSGVYTYSPAVALTADGVSVTVEAAIRYQVVPQEFTLLVRNYPSLDYDDIFLVPQFRQIVRDVISKYTLNDLIDKRPQIVAEIENRYIKVVDSDSVINRTVRILSVNILNIALPQQITDAINNKIAAQQNAIAAQYAAQRITTLAQANASQVVILANASATSLLLQARAMAERNLLLANATRAALEYIKNVAPNDTGLLAIYLYLQGLNQVVQGGGQVIVILGSGGATAPIIVPIPQRGG
jgi:regulator of protease activity HflC (stomatin/prohibitin superfamily)